MKKTELVELGLTTEQIKGIQKIHNKDIMRERRKAEEQAENASTRAAITGVVSALEKPESLARVLQVAKVAYRRELVRNDIREAIEEEVKEENPQ